MNLIIDQGNTLCKIACIEPNGSIAFSSVLKALTPEIMQVLIQTYSPVNGILAKVKEVDPLLVELLKATLKTFVQHQEHLAGRGLFQPVRYQKR